MVRVDSELAMVVMPAHYRLVPLALRERSTRQVELATESDFRNSLPALRIGCHPAIRAFVRPARVRAA